jgi:hypothetical protein
VSNLSDAFDQLLDACDEASGSPQFAIVNGRKVRAIIEEITSDEIMMAGGIAESGGFRVQVRWADFAQKPEQGDSVEARDQDLEVVSVVNRNDVVYEIAAGALVKDNA